MKKYFYLVVLILTQISCASSYIESNKSPSLRTKAKKIFVVADGSQDDLGFFRDVLDKVYAKLTARGVAMKGYLKDPLVLDEKTVIANMTSEFNPDFILYIRQAARTVNVTSGILIGTSRSTGSTILDIKLFKMDSDIPLWRANLQVQGGLDFESASKQATKSLVSRLIRDEII